jgi:hypothetical protein
MEQFHVQSKQFITYLLLLIDYVLKVAFFICNTLSEMIHKISKTWRNSPWFMITVLPHIAHFSSFSVCRWFLHTLSFSYPPIAWNLRPSGLVNIQAMDVLFVAYWHTTYCTSPFPEQVLNWYIVSFLGVLIVPSVPLPTAEVHSEICQSTLCHTVYQYVCSAFSVFAS